MRRVCDITSRASQALVTLIGCSRHLTCHPGSAPNNVRLVGAPRTSPLNTNCIKGSSILMLLSSPPHLISPSLVTSTVGSDDMRLQYAN
jgi:hypothetical protein